MQSKKLAQIKQQIAKLEREADKVRKAGVKGVVKQIKDLMEEHGIALADLGAARGRPGRPAKAGKPGPKPARPAAKAAKPGRKPGRPAKAATAAAKPAKATVKTKKASRAKSKPKYRSADNAKLVWSGRGRPPTWAKSWVDAGKKLDDLLIK